MIKLDKKSQKRGDKIKSSITVAVRIPIDSNFNMTH
jgi:hypothetical protein